MTQKSIVVSTTPPLPGLSLVNQVNDALEALGTDFAGATDPAAFAKAYMTWADTGNMLSKQRNAANSAWVTIGPLLTEMAAKTGDAAQKFRVAPSTAANEAVAQSQAFGVGQTLQDVSASRAVDTTYTNSTGKPITVYIIAVSSGAGGTVALSANGLTYQTATRDSGAIGVSISVPDGKTYSVSVANATVSKWEEYR